MPSVKVVGSNGRTAIAHPITKPVSFNRKGRPVYIGERGGLFVMRTKRSYYYPGKKTAIISKHVGKPVGLNHKKRTVYLGARGGTYIVKNGEKVYGYPGRGKIHVVFPVSAHVKSKFIYRSPSKTRANLLKVHIRA